MSSRKSKRKLHKPYLTQTKWFSKECEHPGTKPVMIGGYPVYLAREKEVTDETLANVDIVIPLNGYLPLGIAFGTSKQLVFCSMQDHGGVPDNFKQVIEQIVELIKSGKKILAYCTGSHGRTGCFAASLLVYLEPDILDPVQEIRNRHCKHALESQQQVEAVFALKGVEVPKQHKVFQKLEVSTRPTTTSYKPLSTRTFFDNFGEDDEEEVPFDLTANEKLERFLSMGNNHDLDVVENPTNEDINDILSQMHRHRKGYID